MKRPGAVPWIPFVLIAVAVTSLPYLFDPPARDQGVFSVIAWRWLSGDSPYLSAGVEHKGPLPFAAYAIGFRFFGLSMASARFMAWLAQLLAALGLAALATRLFAADPPGGGPGGSSPYGTPAAPVVAASLYLLVIGHGGLSAWWSGAQAEAFMEPFVVGAMLLALAPGAGRSRALAAGALLGLATLGKPTALLMAPIVGAALARTAGRWWALAAGLVVPWAIAALYFAFRGAAGAFFDSVFLANLDYGGQGLRQAPARLPAFVGSHQAAIPLLLLVPALAGALRFGRRPAGRLVIAWLVAAWLQVLGQGRMFGYHYLPVMAPLSLLVTGGLMPAFRARGRVARGLGVAALLVAMVALARLPWSESRFRWERATGRVRPAAFRAHFSTAGGAFDVDPVETERAAAWAAAHLAPDQSLLVWGFEPAVNFLARRRPASRFLYDYFLTSPAVDPGRQARDRALFMRDIEARPPGAVAVVHDDRNPIERDDSASQLRNWPGLADWLTGNYEPAARIGDFEFFLRRR